MTIKVELNPEIEAWLAAGARARGMSIEQYAKSVLHEALAQNSEPSGQLTPEELQAMLKAIAEGSEQLPRVSTSAFTRESFYEDRQ